MHILHIIIKYLVRQFIFAHTHSENTEIRKGRNEERENERDDCMQFDKN